MVVDAAGGSLGLRDLGALESAVAQPQATFEGRPLYPDVNSMAAALGYSIVANHPFIDGNKRAGHAAMEPGTRSLLVDATDRFRGIE